jgi:hypothetical protein
MRRLGAKGGTRTHTALGHWLLRPARLPIPPLSHDGKHIKKDRGALSSVLARLVFGAPTRTRTWNQQIKSLLLYQLSYGGVRESFKPLDPSWYFGAGTRILGDCSTENKKCDVRRARPAGCVTCSAVGTSMMPSPIVASSGATRLTLVLPRGRLAASATRRIT